MNRNCIAIFIFSLFLLFSTAFKLPIFSLSLKMQSTFSSTECQAGPRPIHSKFTVEKTSDERMKELGVLSWPMWSTNDSTKYQVGIKSPRKVYDCNELSYIGAIIAAVISRSFILLSRNIIFFWYNCSFWKSWDNPWGNWGSHYSSSRRLCDVSWWIRLSLVCYRTCA